MKSKGENPFFLFWKRVLKIFDWILDGLGFLSGLLVLAMMVAVTYDVVMRYFLARPTIWIIDSTGFAMIFFTSLGAAWVLKGDGHIKIDFVVYRFGVRTKAAIDFVTSIVSLLACVLFLYWSWRITWDMYRGGDMLIESFSIPKHIVYWPIVAGALLLCLQFVRKIWQHWQLTRKGA